LTSSGRTLSSSALPGGSFGVIPRQNSQYEYGSVWGMAHIGMVSTAFPTQPRAVAPLPDSETGILCIAAEGGFSPANARTLSVKKRLVF